VSEADHEWTDALESLGAGPGALTERERQALDESGYVVFPALVSPEWLDRLRTQFDLLSEREGGAAGSEVGQERGARRLSDLVNKGDVFDGLYTQPKVLAAVAHVLGRPFKLSSLNARDALPGDGNQALHVDWRARAENEPFAVVNSIWMLDAFTDLNGATRVVPGTHRRAGAPRDHLADPAAPYPDQVLLTGPAGTVAVFNAHLWHGGTTNRTEGTRRAIHCYFTAREFPQQSDQKEFVRKRTWDRISPAARYILDV
jgi:ectoine hydroxylase-related dioxygenase (phytanoyl-CoA dioxygenase family)